MRVTQSNPTIACTLGLNAVLEQLATTTAGWTCEKFRTDER
jgi:hypothetical protein